MLSNLFNTLINNKIINLILITSLPITELRGGIPYGISSNLPLILVFLICVVTNIIIGIIVFLCFKYLIRMITYFPFLERYYNRFIVKTQHKINNLVQKYGTVGLSLFIAIPLPGSGVYTGAIGANFLGIRFKDFIIADIVGVIIAATIVTLISTGFLNLWYILS